MKLKIDLMRRRIRIVMVRKDFEECILLQQKEKRKSEVIGFTPSRNPKMFQDFSVHEWLV